MAADADLEFGQHMMPRQPGVTANLIRRSVQLPALCALDSLPQVTAAA